VSAGLDILFASDGELALAAPEGQDTTGRATSLLDAGVPERLERANTLGAFAVTTHGDWEGLPTRAEMTMLDRPHGDVVR
jgi:hypothetical protein